MRKDITGGKFGRLTALFRSGSDRKGSSIWACRCECGNEKEVNIGHLGSGFVKSCGCLRNEGGPKKHGMAKTRQWFIWMNMKRRCNLKTDREYKNYGGRGITVDSRWLDFSAFWDDMKDGYSDKLTLERVDVNGNYCKENCKWIPRSEQNSNKRDTVFVSFRGERRKLIDLANETGINYYTLYNRIMTYKMPVEYAIDKKLHAKRWRRNPGTLIQYTV